MNQKGVIYTANKERAMAAINDVNIALEAKFTAIIYSRNGTHIQLY